MGGQLRVTGSAPGWQAQLSGWCSDQGHGLRWEDGVDAAQAMAIVARGGAQAGRWRGAAQTGRSDARSGDGAVAAQAQPFWGLAARGAQVEAGAPAFHFRLSDKLQVWTGSASDLYAQAVAAQWNADTDIDWNDAPELPAPVEDAIVQLMTYMVENENAALLVPARFLGQLHPHYRELQAALAIQVADEARHIDVFTRRIRRHGREPALSTAGGQASLKSLLDETDFSVAGFLLSVLGEGTFVHLLQFLQTEAPDPSHARSAAWPRATRRAMALGMSHLLYRLQHEPGFQHQLAQAVEQRFDNLAGTSGLNEEVFDALILIAAGTLTPEALARGAARVQQLMRDMADGRFPSCCGWGSSAGMRSGWLRCIRAISCRHEKRTRCAVPGGHRTGAGQSTINLLLFSSCVMIC